MSVFSTVFFLPRTDKKAIIPEHCGILANNDFFIYFFFCARAFQTLLRFTNSQNIGIYITDLFLRASDSTVIYLFGGEDSRCISTLSKLIDSAPPFMSSYHVRFSDPYVVY